MTLSIIELCEKIESQTELDNSPIWILSLSEPVMKVLNMLDRYKNANKRGLALALFITGVTIL